MDLEKYCSELIEKAENLMDLGDRVKHEAREIRNAIYQFKRVLSDELFQTLMENLKKENINEEVK